MECLVPITKMRSESHLAKKLLQANHSASMKTAAMESLGARAHQ